MHEIAKFESDGVRPEQVADRLGMKDGKLVRSFLRKTFVRPIEAKNTAWFLSADQANATIDHFVARRSPVEPPKPRTIEDVRAELAELEAIAEAID